MDNFDNNEVNDGQFKRPRHGRTQGKGKFVYASFFFSASSPSNSCSSSPRLLCGRLLTFEQTVRRRAVVPVDVVVMDLGIFRALQREAAVFNEMPEEIVHNNF